MEPSIGVTLPSFPVQGLAKVRDLEFFDGPLLTEFKTERGDTYLYSWCAASEAENRWMVFRTSRSDLAKYTHQRISFLDLLRACQDGFVYLLDIAHAGDTRRIQLSTLDQLPPSYLPAQGSLFDPDLMPEGKWTHDILLDGAWDLGELAEFPRTYKDVYSFLYLLGARPSNASPSLTHPFSYNIRGGRGWVVRQLYNELERHVPPSDRPRLEAIQYASPGIISIYLNPETADIIPQAVHQFSTNALELAWLYRDVYKSTHGRTERSEQEIQQMLKRLIELLGFIDWERLCDLTGSITQLADVVLAYYRRIERLFEYQQQGKATIL